MPIYEVEPRVVLGPFRLGSKLVRELSETDQGITIIRKSDADPLTGWIAGGVFAEEN